MSTKQVRLSHPTQIRDRINEFLGKQINIVLFNGNTFTGLLKTISNTEITITNMRLKKMLFAFNEISELYFDLPA